MPLQKIFGRDGFEVEAAHLGEIFQVVRYDVIRFRFDRELKNEIVLWITEKGTPEVIDVPMVRYAAEKIQHLIYFGVSQSKRACLLLCCRFIFQHERHRYVHGKRFPAKQLE